MLKNPIFRLIYIVIGFLAIYSLSRSVYDLWRRMDILSQRKAVFERLQAENTHLKQQLAWQQTPQFVEREAREKLNMSKPGETVILLQNATPSAEANGYITGGLFPKASWMLWWRLFF
jgi:cell division protein FtsB